MLERDAVATRAVQRLASSSCTIARSGFGRATSVNPAARKTDSTPRNSSLDESLRRRRVDRVRLDQPGAALAGMRDRLLEKRRVQARARDTPCAPRSMTPTTRSGRRGALSSRRRSRGCGRCAPAGCAGRPAPSRPPLRRHRRSAPAGGRHPALASAVPRGLRSTASGTRRSGSSTTGTGSVRPSPPPVSACSASSKRSAVAGSIVILGMDRR